MEFNKDHLYLAFIGRQGQGKTCTGNTILGTNAFDSTLSPNPGTTKCEIAESSSKICDKHLTVIDTPGITMDFKEKDIGILTKAIMKIGNHKINAFIYTTQISRIEKRDVEFIKHFRNTLGKEFYEHLFILFTCKDMLDHDGMTFDQFFAESDPELQSLVEKYEISCFVIDNLIQRDDEETEKQAERRKEQKRTIESLIRKVPPKVYTHENEICCCITVGVLIAVIVLSYSTLIIEVVCRIYKRGPCVSLLKWWKN